MDILNKIKNNHWYVGLVAVVVLISGLSVYKFVFAEAGHDEAPAVVAAPSPARTSVSVETASTGDADKLGTTNASLTGEILSISDVQLFPAREGQIAEWYVRLGKPVTAGQVIGRLAPAPVTPEQTSALAERQAAVVRARAQYEATKKFIADAQNQTRVLEGPLKEARDAQVRASERDLQTLIGTEAAAGIVDLKITQARNVAQRILQKYVNEFKASTVFSVSNEVPANFQFKTNTAMLDESAKQEFLTAAHALSRALRESPSVPETTTSQYVKASLRVVVVTVPTSGDGFTQAELSDLRKDINEDQKDFLDAVNDISEARLTIEQAKSRKATVIADTDVTLAEKKSELNQKISELQREAEVAEAEVSAAQAAYGTMSSGAAGQSIIAPRSGIISGVYKNTGDSVTPQDAVAAISSKDTKGRYVKFRIPSDAQLPVVGEEIQIERPGYPLQPVKARVTGVGLALDAGGWYSAEADFVKPTDWPVHSSVRVVVQQRARGITVPFSAIWWNDKGEAQVWIVMENNIIRPQGVKIGRAIGDRIEVELGLQSGDVFVSRATQELKTGQSIVDTSVKAPSAAPAPGGDGHDHEH